MRLRAPAIAGFLCAASVNAAALELAVEAKPRAVVSEPIELSVRVRNDGTEAHPGFHLDHRWEDFEVWIAREGEAPRRFLTEEIVRGWSERREARCEPEPLEPGEVREALVPLSWDVGAKDFALARPGRHTVEVRTKVAGSASLTIDVMAPAGADAEALAFIRANGLETAISEDTRWLDRDDPRIPKLEAFIERFGETAYAAYVRRALHGFGRGPRLDVFPERAGFGNCPVGETRECQLTIKSNGSEPVQIERIAGPEAPFEWVGEPLPTPLVLQPQRMRDFRVLFRPPVKGRFGGTIVFHCDDWSGRPVRVELFGVGD